MDFDNKQIKVDEDEGSPLQNGANFIGGFDTPLCGYSTANKGKSNDQRKPSGYANPSIFPSKDNFADNTTRVIMWSKGNMRQKKVKGKG